MKRISLTTVFVIFLTGAAFRAFGQHKVSGRVMDETHQAVGYATVTLLKAADSSLVKGMVTDSSGAFTFTDVPSGKYRVAASLIGMTKVYSLSFGVGASHSSKKVEPLILKPNANQLKEVNVTASKPFITHEIDKTVVNVANSIVSAGNSAWEILQKSPGVTVDNSNNTIRLQGKTGVIVYVDGKPTHLSQEQLANMLKNMSSGSIKSIEIMTQPSAKYDAAGNAGIINIITKKSKEAGFNGSVTAGYTQGKYGRENGGVNLNYRNGKMNFYSNYNYTHAKWWNDNRIIRNFYDEMGKNLSTRSEQYVYAVSPSSSHHFKAGMDYYLDDKNTIGLMMNGSVNSFSNDSHNTTNFKAPDASLQSQSLTHNTSAGKWTNFTYDLNYQGHFDSAGKELSIDMAYSKFDNSRLAHYHTDNYYPDGTPLPDLENAPNPIIRKGSLPSLIDIKTVKIDYTLPLKHETKLSFGVKTSFVTSDNNVEYFHFDNDNRKWLYDSATNHFKYTENINATYVNFNKKFKKGWGLQLGLRGEQTMSKGHQFTNDSTVKRNYFQLFPSIYLSKKLNKNNTLNVSYSRRIDRPNYQDLNPFRYYIDPYTYNEGNPFLQPQLTNSLKLAYAHKSLLTAALSYSNTSDVMSQVLKQDDSARITYQTKENLSRMQNIGLNISLSIPVTKWWVSNNYINIFHNVFQGEFLGAYLDFGRTAYTFHSTNTFTLPAHFKAELSGYYNSSMQWSIFTSRPQYSLSAGIQKSFLKDKADIKLNVNDIFHTQHGAASVKYQNLDVSVNNHWDSQQVSLTFTWRFNKGNAKPVKHHQSAIEEEQNRIKK